MNRSLFAGATTFSFLVCLLGATQSNAQQVRTAQAVTPQERSAMVSHEILGLQMMGGGTALTPAEQQAAARVVDTALRTNAAAWRRSDAALQQLLINYRNGDEAHRVYVRELSRYGYEFPGAGARQWPTGFAIERQIVEAHDPLIAKDPVRKLIVTEHMLPYLRQVSNWVASIYHVQAPGPQFEEIVRAELRQNFTREDVRVATGFAHIEEDSPYPVRFFSTPKDRLVAYVTKTQSTFSNARDARSEQFTLAVTAGNMARFATASGGGVSSSGGSNSLQRAYQAYQASTIMALCGSRTTTVDRVNNGCAVQ